MENVATFTPPRAGIHSQAFSLPTLMFSFFAGVLLSMWFVRSPASKVARGVASAIKVGEPVKMVLVVRKDLKMSAGKIGAQCSHAAVAVVDEVRELELTKDTGSNTPSWTAWMTAWKATGSTKIALQIDGEEPLLKIHGAAIAANLPTYVIADAGRTQIAAGSRTVVAVGPAPASKVDEITGGLKIL